MMTVTTYRRNRAWLNEHSGIFQHQCDTKKNYPRPEDVKKKMPGVRFIRVPFITIATWGFMTISDLSEFKKHYVTIQEKEND